MAGNKGENSTGARLEQALQGLNENRRLNILLRQAHQANLRAVASANRDISQMSTRRSSVSPASTRRGISRG
jgi:hypothetical protein